MNFREILMALFTGSLELPNTCEETRERYNLCKKELLPCFITFLVTVLISCVLMRHPVTLGAFDIFPQVMRFPMCIGVIVVRAFMIVFMSVAGAAGFVLQVSRVCFFRRRLRMIEKVMQSDDCTGGKTI